MPYIIYSSLAALKAEMHKASVTANQLAKDLERDKPTCESVRALKVERINYHWHQAQLWLVAYMTRHKAVVQQPTHDRMMN